MNGRVVMFAVLVIIGALDRLARILAESGKVECWTDQEEADATARLISLDKATRGLA
jgi:hypothetical protein